MLGDLHDLALGPGSPAYSMLFASVGCLLAIILGARARRATGWRRFRLLAYVTISVAVVGIWQPGVIGVLGLRVEGSVLRVDLRTVLLSLLAALVATAPAVVLLCLTGKAGGGRILGGAVLLLIAVAASKYLLLEGLATGGEMVYRMAPAGLAVGIAAGCGALLAWALGAAPSLRGAAAAALGLGCGLAGLQLAAAWALWVRVGPAGPVDADTVPGLPLMTVGLPSVVLAAGLAAMMWYFSVGAATLRDLRLAFGPDGDAEQIEPWIIEQVQARVALSSTARAGGVQPTPEPGAPAWAQLTVPVRAVPLIGGSVAAAFALGARTGRANADGVLEPGWRPVPGWGTRGASRAVLTPAPLSPPMYPPDAAPERPRPRRGGRPTPGWFETTTRAQDWIRAGQTNEHRIVTGGRPTNERHEATPRRSPQLVGPNGDGVTPASGPATPLPRRNARPMSAGAGRTHAQSIDM